MTFHGPDEQREQPVERPVARGQAGGTVDFLSGDWTVTRRISDHRTGQVGSFRGTASLRNHLGTTPERTLTYAESGELRFGSHRGPASRSLLIVDAGDGAADVRFADGREFYRLDLRAGSCAAEHPCRADLYRVTVSRLSADSYTETWRVTGPSKDYELQTAYSRADYASSEQVAGPSAVEAGGRE